MKAEFVASYYLCAALFFFLTLCLIVPVFGSTRLAAVGIGALFLGVFVLVPLTIHKILINGGGR